MTELAQQGGPDEREVPRHTRRTDDVEQPPDTLEDSAAYELAVEDGTVLAPGAVDENAGIGPEADLPGLREPGDG